VAGIRAALTARIAETRTERTLLDRERTALLES
jgi:hypothetical protein